MAIAQLPRIHDLESFKNRLYTNYGVEIPYQDWQGKQYLRISVQGYNTREDIDALLRALRAELGL